jgi:hypothetical protein
MYYLWYTPTTTPTLMTLKSFILQKRDSGEMILNGSTRGLETPCGCAQGE